MRLARTAVAIVALALFAFAPAPARADSTDDDIRAMLELATAGKEDECVAKMDVVRAGREKRAYVALHELATTSKSDKIASGAIHALVVGWRDADTFRWLVGKIGDKTLYDRTAGRPELYKCVLASLRDFPPERVKQALKPLADAVARFMATDPEYTDLAIRAYGTVPDRFTVQQLLQWLDQSSAPAKGDAKANNEKAKASVLATLATLCAHEEPDAASWKKWWEANAKTFKFPEAPKQGDAAAAAKPAPVPGADPSGLSEFKDDAYGWSVKRPEAEWWKFMKPDYGGPRVALRCGGEGTEIAEMGRAYFGIHDPGASEPRDVASFATWVIANNLKNELPEDGIILKPSTKTVTANGVEWTVVTARGLGGGVKSNWGSMERRFYITKVGAKILYVDAFIVLRADAEDKTALWNCIESIAITAK